MSYVAQRLEAAVLMLVAEGPVKQRLKSAYALHLEELEAADVPRRLGAPLARLHGAMHRVAPMGTTDSRVTASVQKMSPTEAGEHAAAIVRLYVELLRAGQRAEPLKVVESSSAPVAATSS